MTKHSLPIVTLRDVVSLPGSVLPLFISRARSLAALDAALDTDDRTIILCTQKDPDIDDPVYTDMYEIGTVAEIYQLLKFPDGSGKVLLESLYRIRLESMEAQEYLTGEYSQLQDVQSENTDAGFAKLVDAYQRWARFAETPRYIWIRFPADYENRSLATDRMAAHLPMAVEDKIACLSETSVAKRIDVVLRWTEKLHAEHSDELAEFEELWEETPQLSDTELTEPEKKRIESLASLFPEVSGGLVAYSAKPENMQSLEPQLTYLRISSQDASLYLTNGLSASSGCEVALLTKGGPLDWPFTIMHQLVQSMVLKRFDVLKYSAEDGFTVVFLELPGTGVYHFLLAQLSHGETPVVLAIALHEDEADAADPEELLNIIKEALGGRFSALDRQYLG